MASEINFMVGGEAGQGVQTIGFILAKTLARAGLYVFADQDYESRVRGGHNFYRVRARADKVQAICEKVDILVAIDQQSIELHNSDVRENGISIFDKDKIKTEGKKLNSIGISLEQMAEQVASNKLLANSVAIGAAIAVAGYKFDLLGKVLEEHFKHLGDDAINQNLNASRTGYDYVTRQRPDVIRQQVQPVMERDRMMLLNGNEAIALGAMAAGCKFMAAYPMTPASTIMEYMADKGRKYNIVVVQPEDEIAAMNMTVGAGYAGVRAMTATSGDGFALMSEAFGLAGVTETPVVVVIGQRPGPGVGLPTRTEQGELGFAIYGGSGEFPRAVLAPSSIEDAFWITVKAFNLAEKYQIPVVILTDQHLASSYQTVEKFKLANVKIDRGQLLSEEESNRAVDYKRHRFTESGISPRAIPLQGKALVVTDSDEHDEAGHMIEDAELRRLMMVKRLKKYDAFRGDLEKPILEKKTGAEITLIGWGSTYGAIKEASDLLEAEGTRVNILHLNEIWPLPGEAIMSVLGETKKSIVIENNATGQLVHLIAAETGTRVSASILKFDGRPFSPEYIVREIKRR
jgi:2-oxoglutarate ferredoxin oxidoreductase subunit alpha